VGESTAISVRQHEIEIMPAKPTDVGNVIQGVVNRQVFLGSARDYTVALPDKTELRVTAAPAQDIAPGKEVWLRLPAERCRALMGGSET
jgi:iron(III) transport system ATP-binding protein